MTLSLRRQCKASFRWCPTFCGWSCANPREGDQAAQMLRTHWQNRWRVQDGQKHASCLRNWAKDEIGEEGENNMERHTASQWKPCPGLQSPREGRRHASGLFLPRVKALLHSPDSFSPFNHILFKMRLKSVPEPFWLSLLLKPISSGLSTVQGNQQRLKVPGRAYVFI